MHGPQFNYFLSVLRSDGKRHSLREVVQGREGVFEQLPLVPNQARPTAVFVRRRKFDLEAYYCSHDISSTMLTKAKPLPYNFKKMTPIATTACS